MVKLLKKDTDLAIKKNCMDSLSQITYNSETKKCLQNNNIYIDLINLALLDTPIKKELIETVDLGAFKHVVDNGVPIRRSAYILLKKLCEGFNFN